MPIERLKGSRQPVTVMPAPPAAEDPEALAHPIDGDPENAFPEVDDYPHGKPCVAVALDCAVHGQFGLNAQPGGVCRSVVTKMRDRISGAAMRAREDPGQ